MILESMSSLYDNSNRTINVIRNNQVERDLVKSNYLITLKTNWMEQEIVEIVDWPKIFHLPLIYICGIFQLIMHF